MKTIDKPQKNSQKGFNILITSKKKDFQTLLTNILSHEPLLFPDVDFTIEHLVHPIMLHGVELANFDLVFMEDVFLIELHEENKRLKTNPIDRPVILLLNSDFTGTNIQGLKKAIDRNLLNLTGHISLANYTFDLIRLLLIDFIKNRLRVYETIVR